MAGATGGRWIQKCPDLLFRILMSGRWGVLRGRHRPRRMAHATRTVQEIRGAPQGRRGRRDPSMPETSDSLLLPVLTNLDWNYSGDDNKVLQELDEIEALILEDREQLGRQIYREL